MVDKNLFLHDLAVVAIMKDEEPYVKEWLDYHLLAGVDHFFIYDNDSTAKFKEILKPYIDADIVTYTPYPGKCRQMEAHLDAIRRFRFFCRYMTMIDGDEFILPKDNKNIVEVLDEIFSESPKAAGLGVNIQMYGSNNQNNADYTSGVLERFTARGQTPSDEVSSIVNPRRVDYYPTPHAPIYFATCYAINENGGVVNGHINSPPSAQKIVMNHYHFKSYEEYEKKVQRGNADHFDNHYSMERFLNDDNRNDVFDDGILKYRDERQRALIPAGNIDGLFPSKQINYSKIWALLSQCLSLTQIKRLPQNFYEGGLETFLTCLNLCSFFKEKFIEDKGANIFEELALDAIAKTLRVPLEVFEVILLLDEMPKILALPYPIVDEIRQILMEYIQRVMLTFRRNNYWDEFRNLEYKLNMLKNFDSYTRK